MTCSTCSTTVESALQAIPGVQKAQVALATEEAQVQYDPKIVTQSQILETIEDTGFEAILISSGEDRSNCIDLLYRFCRIYVESPFSGATSGPHPLLHGLFIYYYCMCTSLNILGIHV